MKARALAVALALLMAAPLAAQEKRDAPKFMAFSVQGTTVNLDYYKGKKSILLIFFRKHD